MHEFIEGATAFNDSMHLVEFERCGKQLVLLRRPNFKLFWNNGAYWRLLVRTQTIEITRESPCSQSEGCSLVISWRHSLQCKIVLGTVCRVCDTGCTVRVCVCISNHVLIELGERRRRRHSTGAGGDARGRRPGVLGPANRRAGGLGAHSQAAPSRRLVA